MLNVECLFHSTFNIQHLTFTVSRPTHAPESPEENAAADDGVDAHCDQAPEADRADEFFTVFVFHQRTRNVEW
jgi:hypothetical protein